MVQSLRLRRTTSTIRNESRTPRTRLMKGGEVDARPYPSVKIPTQTETSKGDVKMTSMAAVTMIAVSLFGSAEHSPPELQPAEPAAGAAMTTSPKQIRITFNESVIAQCFGGDVVGQA